MATGELITSFAGKRPEGQLMRRVNWYVVQVQVGREQQTCQVVERANAWRHYMAREGERQLLAECFTPRFRTQRKVHGVWEDVERLLLPGYIIVVTDEPAELDRLLKLLSVHARVLRMGETYTPLRDEECSWIESNTQKGNRVVPMSFGYKKGSSIIITEGPLVGREGQIVRLNRAKSTALLEFHVGAMTIKTKVGLGIVPSGDTRE